MHSLAHKKLKETEKLHGEGKFKVLFNFFFFLFIKNSKNNVIINQKRPMHWTVSEKNQILSLMWVMRKWQDFMMKEKKIFI